MTPKSPMTDLIERLEARLAEIGGCMDGHCLVVRPTGMHTNGGCRCWKDAMTMQRVLHAYRSFKADLTDALEASLSERREADAGRVEALEAALAETRLAADAILGRVTMVAGRYLYDAPSADLVPVLAEEGVELTALMFRHLYDATATADEPRISSASLLPKQKAQDNG